MLTDWETENPKTQEDGSHEPPSYLVRSQASSSCTPYKFPGATFTAGECRAQVLQVSIQIA